MQRIKQTYCQGIEETETFEEVVNLEDLLGTYQIIIYNDDVNTFEWVIECLQTYCDHKQQQAEQCAWFIHFKGKYGVKSGAQNEMKPICQTLAENGLNAKLEQA